MFKKLLLIILLFINCKALMAQDKEILLKSDGTWEYIDSDASQSRRRDSAKVRKNQLKINLTQLAFASPQLSYERSIKDNFTIGGSMHFFVVNSAPFFIDLGEFNEIAFSGDELDGFGIMPQFKWYPNFGNRKAPHGFYLGGLLRYQYAEYNTDVRYEDLTSSVDFNFNTQLNSYGIGMEIGYQIKFKNNILLDFSFFGPRYVFNTISFDSSVAIEDEVVEALTQEVNNAIGIELFDIDLDRIDFNEKDRFSSLGFRYAISLGYCF